MIESLLAAACGAWTVGWLVLAWLWQCTHTHNELSQDSPVTFAKVESSVTKSSFRTDGQTSSFLSRVGTP
jgi:hypothetical protein